MPSHSSLYPFTALSLLLIFFALVHANNLRSASTFLRTHKAPELTDFASEGGLLEDVNITKVNVTEEIHQVIPTRREFLGGRNVQPGEFPSYVQWAIGCGGTLVHEDIVLTAAHCYNSEAHRSDRVWVGSYNSKDGEKRRITDFIQHQEYSSDTDQFDFLMLKLDRPVNITPVTLNDMENVPDDNDVLTVIGFGSDTENGWEGATTLRKVNVEYMQYDLCSQSYMGHRVDRDVSLCAGHGGEENCQGDSGGPVFASNGVQVGVASWSYSCDRAFPAVYARVSYAYSWIQNQICMHSSNPPADCTPISVNFETDSQPSEIEWLLKAKGDNGNEQIVYQSFLDAKPNSKLEHPLMLMPGTFKLEVTDFYGDGIEEGGYSIWTGRDFIDRSGNFGAFDSVEFTVESGGAKYITETTRLLQAAIESDESSDESEETTHTIEIEIKYDGKPTETSWSLFKKPAEEIYTSEFNSTTTPDLRMHATIDDLESGKYWFRILDDGMNGICCGDGEGWYKLTDVTNGKNKDIYHSDGQFMWFEYIEFELSFD